MSTIVATRRPTDPSPVRGTDGPQPGLLDTIGASFRLAEDDQMLTQAPRNADAYRDLLATLADLGVDVRESGPLYSDATGTIPGDLRTHRVFDRDAIYAEVLRQRSRDPKLFKGMPATREEYDMWVARRRGGRDADQRTAARGGVVGNLVGGVASGMTDPYNLATMPAGAGQVGIVRTMLIEGLLGGITELPNLSSTALAREKMGETYTVGDMAEQVGVSALASAGLGGAVRAVEIGTPKAGARLERLVIDNWDKLPAPVRARLADGQWDKLTPDQRAAIRDTSVIRDADLPALAEALIGRGNMTPDERLAIDLLRRDSEVAAGSPFKPGMAGDAAHRTRLDEALSTLLQPVERGSRPFALPPRPGAADSGRGALMSGTSLTSSAPNGGARAALKSKIRHAESRGDDGAKNPLSSATGRYQFTSGTWLAYYKRRFGAQGLTDAQILAKRGDGRLQDVLMDDLTADNAAFLRSIGEAESAGNLYLTHFAGQGGARKLFAADPGADAGAVLGASVVRANPWMRGYSAGDVIAWAHRKMDEAAPRRAGARSELADEGAWRDGLQAEIDRIDAEADAARANADDPFMAALRGAERALPSTDHELVPVDGDAIEPLPPARGDAAQAAAALTDREAALLPGLRAEIAGTAKLSDLKGLAKRLDATEAEVGRALEQIAALDRGSIVRGRGGLFRRAPKDRGPVDAFRFLARAGGIADDEGHELIERFGVDARTARTDELTRKRVAGARRQSKIVPGAGPLVRKSGMPIDAAGERLFEAGYLQGADGGRPTVAETIAFLERGMEGPDTLRTMVPLDRLSEVDAWVAPEAMADMRAHMGEWAHSMAPDLSGEDIDALARIMMRPEIANEDAALTALIDEAVLDALDDMRYESGDYDDALARYLDSVDADSSGGRFDADARDAGEGGARGEAGDDWPEPVGDDDYAGWDSPTDRVATEQADSVMHDLAPPRGDAGEEAAPGPAGNFFLDENGDARSWADIAAELDADEAEIQAIRDCL